jgi:methyl-accepting chemotaxis protein
MTGAVRSWKLGTKVLAGVLVVLTLVFATIIGVLSWNERTVFEQQLSGKGENLVRLLASISLDPILSYNFDYLESYAKELGKDPDVAYVVVTDPQGKPLTQAFTEAPDAPGLLRFSAEVKQGDEVKGSVRMALRTAAVEAGIRRSQLLVTAIGLAALALVAAFVVVLFRAVVLRGVESLRESVALVAEGDIGVDLRSTGGDEIALLRGSLADMLDRLRTVVGDV